MNEVISIPCCQACHQLSLGTKIRSDGILLHIEKKQLGKNIMIHINLYGDTKMIKYLVFFPKNSE